MFDVSWSELLLIAVVALVFIGPKELPGVLRTIGQWTSKIRRMAGEFQDQFREAVREVEMADIKKDIDEATKSLNTDLTKGLDPFDGIKESMEWKPPEPASTPAPAADAPPAPPAEAVTAEATPAAAAPAQADHPATPESAPTGGDKAA